MILAVVLLAVGLPLASKAADQFVTAASRVSALMGVSPLVIGAVVVGFGTSMPELFVTALSAGQDAGDLGAGNILGASTANLTLTLGAAALVAPIIVRWQLIVREIPMALGACALFVVLSWNGVDRWNALVLAIALGAAIVLLLRWGRQDQSVPDELNEGHDYNDTGPKEILRLVLGLAGVVVAAQLVVQGGVIGAGELGVAETFVGFSVVTIGTSLPELVTCVVAARRGQSDLAVGNIVGSNLFNCLGVGAVLGLVGTGVLEEPATVHRAGVALLVAAVVSYVFMRTRPGVLRWEGTVLVALFGAALVFLLV